MSIPPAPEEKKYLNVGTKKRIRPYALHRRINRPDVEVVQSNTDEDSRFMRIVATSNGDYEVWVRVEFADEYGYALTPDERVTEAEFDAITLKQRAINGDPEITLGTVQAEIEDATSPSVLEHLVIAAFYAAKADPDVHADTVDELRELMHDQTNHVDTTHVPTLKSILHDTLDSEV